jgi:hypothetical protein
MTTREHRAAERVRNVLGDKEHPTDHEVLRFIRGAGAEAVLVASKEDILELANAF